MHVALQVHKAFEYLERSVEADKPDVRYVVRVRRGDGSTTGRGIYLREPMDTLRKLTFMADVKPTFHEVGYLIASPEKMRYIDARASHRHACCNFMPMSHTPQINQASLAPDASLMFVLHLDPHASHRKVPGAWAGWSCWMPAQLNALRGWRFHVPLLCDVTHMLPNRAGHGCAEREGGDGGPADAAGDRAVAVGALGADARLRRPQLRDPGGGCRRQHCFTDTCTPFHFHVTR